MNTHGCGSASPPAPSMVVVALVVDGVERPVGRNENPPRQAAASSCSCLVIVETHSEGVERVEDEDSEEKVEARALWMCSS